MATLRHFQFLFWSLTLMWAGLRADPINDESPSSEEPFPWSHPRLPTSVQPDHYFIHIHPNLRSKTFRGYVHILLTALNQTDLILLNSKHLAVSNASLKQLTMPSYLIKDLSLGVNSPQMEVLDKPNQQELPRDQQGLDQAIISEDVKELLLPLQPISEEYAQSSNSALPPPCHLSVRILESNFSEQLAVIPNTPLRAGYRYLLTLSFSGAFSTRMSGLYAASYKTPNGKARPIAVTHFEPSSARRVFPCFDEPSMKALFTLVIVRDCRHISLSNMPKVSSHLRADGLEEDQYLTSVKMSSYLVAFVICDFAANSAETKSGVKVSVFTANHLINQTNYALEAAVKILDFYEEYFQIPYPLPKLDLVAVPNFEAVAMESWGLLMFRETALLIDGDSTDLRWKFRSSLVTAHELTHQWFGNLVTPCWWQDLWLKEGMASYLEYLPLLQLQPDWHVEDQQLLLSFFKALEQDSFVTSHPMSRPTNQPAEIREMFDVISYAKGASVIRMLHAHLSHPVFERGLQLYLGRHSYSSARPGDLWSAFTEVSIQSGDCVDVNALMDPWIKLAGYPLVSLTVQGTKLLLHQEPFTTIPNNDTDKVWQIPLSFFTSDSLSVTTHLMKSKEEVLDLPCSVLWIKANVKSSGFYRVRYDPALLNGLLCLLKKNHSSLSAADKAGFIDDVFHLARQGALKYSKALTLSLYLRKEREYLPISISCKHISQMILRLQFGKQGCAVHLLKAHLWRVLGRQARAEKWEEEGSLPGQGRRALLLDLGVKSSVVMERMATRHFYFWMATNGRQTLPQSLLGLVWRVGVWRGGHEEWVFLLRQHQRSQSSAERAALLLALCRTTCYKKKKWLLKAAYRGHVFRTQDLTTVVDQLASRPDSNDLVWTFLKENWDKLLLKFPLGSSYLSGMVNSVTSHFHCSRKYDEVYDFFVNQRNLGHMQFVRHALEMIEINTLWLKTNTKAIEFWLRRTYPLAYKTYPLCKKDVTYHLRWGATIHLRI